MVLSISLKEVWQTLKMKETVTCLIIRGNVENYVGNKGIQLGQEA